MTMISDNQVLKTPVISLVALVIVLATVTGFLHLPDVMYYLAIGVFGIYAFLHSKNAQIDSAIVIGILLLCLISLLFNTPPSYFRAYDRLGVYSIIVFVLGPVFYGARLAIDKKILLQRLVLFYSILAFGSFIAYFLGINLFTRLEEESYDIGMGTFSGLTNHSMALGPIAAMASINLFVKVLSENKHRVLNIIILFGCIASTLLSASRAAVGSLLAASIVVLWRLYQGKMGKFVSILFIIVFIAIVSFPIWGGFTSFLQEKQNANIEMGGTFYSRESKNTARIQEFKAHPIIGMGYCTIDPSLDYVNKTNGQIEPGSSWLAIASMTGIIGVLLFVILFFRAFKASIHIPKDDLSSFYCGMLTFFVIHMAVEGYIYAPKSFLSMTLWLLLGAIFGMSKYYKNTLVDTKSAVSVQNSNGKLMDGDSNDIVNE